MSYELMNAIWDIQLPPTPKLVAIALADFADDDGVCWPSYDLLTKKTGIKHRALVDSVSDLKAAGFLSIQKMQGNRNKYRFDLGLVTDSAKREDSRSALNALRKCSKRTSRSAADASLEVQQTHHGSAADALRKCSKRTSLTDESIKEPTNEPTNEPAPPVRDPELIGIARRFAECRRVDAKLGKVTPQAVDYYSNMLSGFIEGGEVTLADLLALASWFETAEGMKSFAYGIGNMPKRGYEHPLKRNLAMYLSRARGNGKRSTNPTDREGFLRYNEAETVPSTQDDDQEELGF